MTQNKLPDVLDKITNAAQRPRRMCRLSHGNLTLTASGRRARRTTCQPAEGC